MAVPLAILVEFAIKSAHINRFRDLIAKNAHSSLRDELGCRRFDVLSTKQDPCRIVLYEIYDNEGAFEFHLQTPHYQAFAKATENMAESVSVRRLTFLDPSSVSEDGRTA
jgi:autoinducer 2-degrading protein